MQAMLDWLVTVPVGVLYVIIFLTAALENLVPPFPSDVVVAFGAFVVARTNHGTLLSVFLAVWAGNVAGAMVVYALGRRYGAERLERRLAGKDAESVDARLHRLFDKYGLPAVFVSRFVPGVRAIVPGFAGATRMSVPWTLAMIAAASAIWYGLISVLAFRAGSDWEQLKAMIAGVGTKAAIIGTVILGAGVVAWLIANRKKRTR
jgi:membrane protein DedA with SNARE-associated domain